MLLGCNRTIVSRWFATYRKLEIEGLLNNKLLVDREKYHPY
ncbi:hypothetical protein [Trichodesmium erythraeum]|nr:hypothetical protein [Trichodesmium erythraeum 21-75]